MLKFLLPSGEAKSEASLIRTLTQYGLNATKFCTEFNQKSLELYPKGLLIIAKVKVNPENKTFILRLENVSVRFIVQSINSMDIERLYDIYRLLFLINAKANKEFNVSSYWGILNTMKRLRKIKLKI